MFRTHVRYLLVVTACALCGCGQQSDRWTEARPVTTRASGVVVFQGEPLEGAVVVFQPADPGGIGASAMTDNQGKFELKTFPPQKGIVPGNYAVVIMKTQSSAPADVVISPDESEPIEMVSVIPEKYGVATTSGLVAEIPEEGTEALEFELD